MKTLPVILMFALCASAETKLGKPLTLKEATSIDTLVANPATYIGKTVQVKGRVSEVCEKAGCWMNLIDPASNKMVRIKVKDGEIVFPKEAIGKTAVAEGTFRQIEMTKEQAIAQAKHEAEENNKPFDASKITSGKTIYQIQGTGAVLP